MTASTAPTATGGTVLVTGGAGFVGREVCRTLDARGLAVRWTTRGDPAAPDVPGVGVRIGELGPDTRWDAALDGVACVIHLAARAHMLRDRAPDPAAEFRRVNRDGTLRLAAEAARAGVRRFVFVSTIGVNGPRTTDAPFTEADPPRPETPYAASKWEAERELWAAHGDGPLELVIVRPPLVYGPGCPGNFRRLLWLAAAGVPLPLRGVHNRRSFISVRNLADFLATCVTAPAAAGETFLVSDGEDLSTAGLVTRLARAMGRTPRLWRCPAWLLRLAARAPRAGPALVRLTESLHVDDSSARRRLGWRPPHPVHEELGRTAGWFSARKGA